MVHGGSSYWVTRASILVAPDGLGLAQALAHTAGLVSIDTVCISIIMCDLTILWICGIRSAVIFLRVHPGLV